MINLHPIAEVFPLLDDNSLDELCSDIAANGLQRQLVLWRGELIDGRNRMRALIRLGKDPGEYCRALADDADPVAFALSANLHRRHLTASQRAMIGQRVKELRSVDASARMVAGRAIEDGGVDLRKGQTDSNPGAHVRQGESNSTNGRASYEAAVAVNVSPRLIDNAQRVVTNGVPELGSAVIGGTVSLGAAAEIAKLPLDEQSEVIAEGPEFVKAVAAERRSARKKATAEVQSAAAVLAASREAEANYVDPYDVLEQLRDLMPRINDKTILAQMLFGMSDENELYRIPELWHEWLLKRVNRL